MTWGVCLDVGAVAGDVVLEFEDVWGGGMEHSFGCAVTSCKRRFEDVKRDSAKKSVFRSLFSKSILAPKLNYI